MEEVVVVCKVVIGLLWHFVVFDIVFCVCSTFFYYICVCVSISGIVLSSFVVKWRKCCEVTCDNL